MSRRNSAQRRWTLAVRTLGVVAVLCALNNTTGSAAGEADRGAADGATIARGQEIAEAHCAVCHAIGIADASPTEINAETAFRLLYKRYPIEMLEEAAKTGIISGHDEMPGFDFALEDARALLAYIDSLAPDQPGYVRKPAAR